MSKSFDDIIRGQLDQFRMDLESDAWSQFEVAQENHDFDKRIEHKLGEHQLEVYPRDWEDLAEKIEREEVLDDFDSFIGASLSGMKMEESSDWDSFEQILDSDEVFDDQILSKVKNHSVSSNANQWPKLSAHLEEIENRRRRIVMTKFVEAAVFILFVLSIMQLFPLNTFSKNSPYKTYSSVEELNSRNYDSSENEVEHENFVISQVVNSNDINVSESSFFSTSEIGENLIASISAIDSDEAEVQSIRSNTNAQQNAHPTINEIAIIDQPLKFVSFDESIFSEDEELEILVAESAGQLLAANDQDQMEGYLSSLEVKTIDFQRAKFLYDLTSKEMEVKKGQYWFNSYGSPDMNFINTPYDQFYGLDAYQNDAYGYSFGASISYETNNWELDGGLSYSSLNYFPQKVVEVTGSSKIGFRETTLKEIIFDIVEIPLNFKYKIFRKNGWRVYANSGISAGIIASATYNIDEYDISAGNRRPGSNGTSFTSTILRQKDFEKGVFSGGSIEKNIFGTLNTGIGITKKLSESISFYAQPTYHHNLSVGGLGPNNDIHNRLSLEIGTKVRI